MAPGAILRGREIGWKARAQRQRCAFNVAATRRTTAARRMPALARSPTSACRRNTRSISSCWPRGASILRQSCHADKSTFSMILWNAVPKQRRALPLEFSLRGCVAAWSSKAASSSAPLRSSPRAGAKLEIVRLAQFMDTPHRLSSRRENRWWCRLQVLIRRRRQAAKLAKAGAESASSARRASMSTGFALSGSRTRAWRIPVADTSPWLPLANRRHSRHCVRESGRHTEGADAPPASPLSRCVPASASTASSRRRCTIAFCSRRYRYSRGF